MYKDRGLIDSYRKEQEFINVFLHNNKSINVELKYTYLQVKSRLSYWKIIKTIKGAYTVFHESVNETKFFEDGYIKRAYHYQGRTTNTIVEMLEYIVKHDIYKVNEKKNAKKYKKVLQNAGERLNKRSFISQL